MSLLRQLGNSVRVPMRSTARSSDGSVLRGDLKLFPRVVGGENSERDFLLLGEEALLQVSVSPERPAEDGEQLQEDPAHERMKSSLFCVILSPCENQDGSSTTLEAEERILEGCDPVLYDRSAPDRSHNLGLAKQLLSVDRWDDGTLAAKLRFLAMIRDARFLDVSRSFHWLYVLQYEPAEYSEDLSFLNGLRHNASSETEVDRRGDLSVSSTYESEIHSQKEDDMNWLDELMRQQVSPSITEQQKNYVPTRIWRRKIRLLRPLSISSRQASLQLETMISLKIKNILPLEMGPSGSIDLQDVRFVHEPDDPTRQPLLLATIPVNEASSSLPALVPGEELSLVYRPAVIGHAGYSEPELPLGKFYATLTCGDYGLHSDFIYRHEVQWKPSRMQGIAVSVRLADPTDTSDDDGDDGDDDAKAKPISVAIHVANLSNEEMELELILDEHRDGRNPCNSLLWLDSVRNLGQIAPENACFAMVDMLPLHQGILQLDGIRLRDTKRGIVYSPESVPQIFFRKRPE